MSYRRLRVAAKAGTDASRVSGVVPGKLLLRLVPVRCAVRPKHCPACGAPSRPLGRPLGIRGHGSRARQVRGPLQPDGPWVTVTIRARRCLCRCGATMLVVPAGVLALRRWCQQVRAGALFPDVRPTPPSWRGRRVAARVATTLAACARPSPRPLSLRQQAFRGASRSRIAGTPVPGRDRPPPARSVSPVTGRDHSRCRRLQRDRAVSPTRRRPVAEPGPTAAGAHSPPSGGPRPARAGTAMHGDRASPY